VPALPKGTPHKLTFEVWTATGETIDISVFVDDSEDPATTFTAVPSAWQAQVDAPAGADWVAVDAATWSSTPVQCRATVDGVVVSDEYGVGTVECGIYLPGLAPAR
jgi:hypothetical protein